MLVTMVYMRESVSPVHISLSVMSDSLRSHGLQHARSPSPSPTPGVYSNSCPLNHPLSDPSPPAFIFPSIRVFSNESFFASGGQSTGVSASASSFTEYSGLISFRMDWFDRLAVQGTLKSLLQHPSSKASVLQCSDFFIVQLSHQYMTTRKTIALTRWTFSGKVMSLLFNMLSWLVIIFLPRNKRLLISWL